MNRTSEETTLATPGDAEEVATVAPNPAIIDDTPQRDVDAKTARSSRWSEFWIYLASLTITTGAVTLILRLWRANWVPPFYNLGDAVASSAHFETTMEMGWYEYTPKLGAPYGQHYNDFPFSDDLHPAIAKFLGMFTDQMGIALNVYYVLGFLLTAVTATWFLRRCGISPAMTVTLSVLYAIAPYHFIRNESHLFLASYYCVPLALGVVVAAVAGKPLWGRREGAGRIRGVLTGSGAGTALIMIVTTYSGAYYAVFTGVLLAAGGLFAFLRDRRFARLGGVVAAGATLVGALVVAMLPDALYEAKNGSDAAAFIRPPQGSEIFSLKFASLILPAPGHRIAALNELNHWYNTNYPFPGEYPALGTIAAVGFLILMLVIPATALAARRSPSALGKQLRELSFLTYAAFLTATIGGFSTLISVFVTESIRGWNRMSIFIALLSLAAVGLLLDQAARSLRSRVRALRQVKPWIVSTVIASTVLMLGFYDQALTTAVPNYQELSAAWNSSEAFVRSLEDSVPPDSMIFQLPNMPFPESGTYNKINESDQLLLYLHNSDLRWSGGGIKGRPQSDWPVQVAAEPPAQMTRDLAAIGFQGIVIDRSALTDGGAELKAQLTPLLGEPTLTTDNLRYTYFSLQSVIDQVNATTAPEHRAEAAASITHVDQR